VPPHSDLIQCGFRRIDLHCASLSPSTSTPCHATRTLPSKHVSAWSKLRRSNWACRRPCCNSNRPPEYRLTRLLQKTESLRRNGQWSKGVSLSRLRAQVHIGATAIGAIAACCSCVSCARNPIEPLYHLKRGRPGLARGCSSGVRSVLVPLHALRRAGRA